MSYNGSGTFVVNSSGQPVVTGTVISSTAFNALTADLATGLSTAITKDGQTTTTARIVFAQGVSSTLVTDATSATTGSIITAGGISMQKALWVGTTATIAGATTMAGITATSLALGGATLGTNALAVTGTTQLNSALNYGGVTLSNAVTGTGNMVLSASPTLTGTLTAAAANFSGTVTATQAGANLLSVVNSASTADARIRLQNTGGSTDLGVDATGPYWQANTFSYVRTVSPLTMLAALTYGGVTLSNSVTGTGNMVLSASPTLTGTLTAATGTFSGNLGVGIATTTNPTGAFRTLQINDATSASSPGLRITNDATGSAAGDGFTLFVGNAGGAGTTAVNYYSIEADPHVWFIGGAEKLRLNSTGLGIGMTPSNVLDITQSTSSLAVGKILNSNAGTGSGSGWHLANGTANARYGLLGHSYTDSGVFVHDRSYIYNDVAGCSIAVTGPIAFSTDAYTEVARFDTSGRLQVGTTAGTGRINMANSGGGLNQINSTGGAQEILNLYSDNNLYFSGPSNIIIRPGGGGEAARFGTDGSFLVGVTSNQGAGVIAASTRVAIGNNGTTGATTPSLYAFQNVGAASTQEIITVANGNAGGTVSCRILASGNIQNTNNSYGAISDIAFKENITDATPKLAALMNVKIRNFNMKHNIELKQIGVIAQELETVFPNLVEQSEDGVKSVKYSVFVPILIKAVQELTTRLAALESK